MALICVLGGGQIILLVVGIANYIRIGTVNAWLQSQSDDHKLLEGRVRRIELGIAGCNSCHDSLRRVAQNEGS
jgi:hypothetical protein